MSRGASPSLSAQPHAAWRTFAKITLNSILYSSVHQITCIIHRWKGNYRGFLRNIQQKKPDEICLFKKRNTPSHSKLSPKRLQGSYECTKLIQKVIERLTHVYVVVLSCLGGHHRTGCVQGG